ncbi:dephospho-CoA kinase [Actinotalea fermentans]|uniref:Dephospho-CoA kinase n=1 Tax=Actinotalea fermentans TaxID=43671 RepID=A0A511YV18_9CELL|nr:dephospho-CoA kinase [Actinotalea fermentans]
MHEDGPTLGPGVLRIGLTGGIAAGKSVVARRLGQLGAAVVDHDVLARSVVDVGTPGLAAVVEAFGDVLTPLGQLDRQALGARVFGDAAALAQLNGIVHPLVRAAAREAEAAAVASGHRVVVHDIPLLVETGQAGHFDVLVVVDAPAELRVQRLVAGRGLTPSDAWSRLAAQADDEARLEAADVVLDGSGAVAELEVQVDAMWERWTRAGAPAPAPGPAT